LKCSRAKKHSALRRRRGCSSPRGNVVVERRSRIKHNFHIKIAALSLFFFFFDFSIFFFNHHR
jgi:hypothetical protein